MSVFYRIHWTDCPPLASANAWSGLWGSTRSEDGSRTQCMVCDGSGEGIRDCPKCHGGFVTDQYGEPVPCSRCNDDGVVDGCENCDGEGWLDCVRGYSCTYTPEELISYFTDPARSGTADGESVVVFEGWQEGTGFEGEPTAIPERIIETLTWEQFVARHASGATA